MGFLFGGFILVLTCCPVYSDQSVVLDQFYHIIQSGKSDILLTSLKVVSANDLNLHPIFLNHPIETRSEPKCETDETILILDKHTLLGTKGMIELGRCSWVFQTNHHLKYLRHRFNSKVYVLDRSIPKQTTIRDFYLLNGALHSHTVEIWESGELKWQHLPLLLRRRNLNQIHFVAAIAEFFPFQVIPNGDVQNKSGLTVEIINDLALLLNFTFEIINNQVDLYGNQLENGSFHGMMGRIANGEVDFGLALASVTDERNSVMDFVPLHVSSDTALFVWKTGATISNSSFFGMFEARLWVSLVFLVVAVIGTSLLIFWLNPHFEVTAWDSLFHTPAALLNQGAPFLPQRLSGRILLLTSLIFGWLAMVILSARLVSHLTTKFPQAYIQSLKDLQDWDMKLYISGDGTDLTKFSKAPSNSIKRTLWDYQISTSRQFYPVDSDLLDTFVTLGGSDSALFYNNLAVQHWISEHRALGCELEMTNIRDSEMGYLPVRRNFEFRELFEYHLATMKESGITDKISNRWRETANTDMGLVCPDSEMEVQEMALEHVATFFAILIGGIVSAILTFVGEMAIVIMKN